MESNDSSYSEESSKRKRDALKNKILINILKQDFYKNKKGGITNMLSKLINKKVKLWCIFADTVGGVRGTWKGTSGIVTDIDDDYICLDNSILIRRILIYRVEIID